ncbi:MAG: ATP-binding protein [Pseudolysinimonas sp.]
MLSSGQREQVQNLIDLGRTRLRAVVGPPGSGKTTVMAFLVRPDVRSVPKVGLGFVSAAVFLDRTSTTESIAAELAAQLSAGVDGFAAHHAAVAGEVPEGVADDRDAADRDLILPLRRLTGHDVIYILFDGIEQVSPGQLPAVIDLVSRLSSPADARLSGVRIIVGARSNFIVASHPGLEHAETVTLPAPAWVDVAAAIKDPAITAVVPDGDGEVPGGWLTVRLAGAMRTAPASFTIADLARSYMEGLQRDMRVDRDHLKALLLLLAAAGTGPVLPIAVLQRAMNEIGEGRPLTEIRTVLSALGPLVQRGNPSQETEHVGLAHAEIANAILENRDDAAA